MATWDYTYINVNGQSVKAQAPVIVSASRSTDIPAFYADWFFHRLRIGYSAWINPFNGVRSYVSYSNTKFIVFWSKNPHPLLHYIDELKQMGIECYIQYTLNDYVAEGLEKNVPNVDFRIETFKKLVEKLGKGRVIWRFDPLILTDKISADDLLHKIEYIGDRLYGYTEKLVFSFADISAYRKVKKNLENNNINYQEFTPEQQKDFTASLVQLNTKWNYQLATCGEKGRFAGIEPNHCVDDRLIIRFGYRSKELLDFLHTEIVNPNAQTLSLFDDTAHSIPEDAIPLDNGCYAIINKSNKDSGQREFCGCMKSKDIGQYDTCPHLCEYCYANTTKAAALANYECHRHNPLGETIIGK